MTIRELSMKIRNRIACWALLTLLVILTACHNGKEDLPTIGFVDAFEDNTIEQATDGFLAALKEKGFSKEDNTINLIYRNAQGDIPTLTQIVKYFIAQDVTFIATNPSLSTITALQNTREIPIFMMVSSSPELMKVVDEEGNAPDNLYGVAENLDYIDSSFSMIPKLLEPEGEQLRVGLLFNQSEPQSVDAFNRMQVLAGNLGVKLIARPVNATADVNLVSGALLNEGIEAFFANPDNTVFSSFETILKACNEAGVPVFTSEAGLVARGAVAAYGADLYQWGHQAGEQAARFLESGSLEGLHWEIVELRKRVFNPEAARRFGIEVPGFYEAVQ
jgi:putative ABC transport system substrate-binding protein